jgi:predicted RNA-binding Zn-ribbon protein involved in translation (DUF1610 family)
MSILRKIVGALAAVIILATVAPQAHAGPGPQLFVRVKSVKAAEALKPGDRVAIVCGACGAVTVVTVDKDRSVLNSFVCPNCHKEFHSMQAGTSGKTHVSGGFALVDSDGDTAHIAAAR